MKVCVTGASGFIGSHLCRRLISDGFGVRGIDVDIRGSEGLRRAGVEVREVDLTGEIDGDAVLGGCDAVIHTAGVLGPSGLPYTVFHEVNVEGTKRIISAAMNRGITRIIHFSSVGILGSVTREPVTEEYPPNPGDGYERTKYEAEQWVMLQAADHAGINVIRPAWVYGPGDRRTHKLFKALKKRRFFFVGNGRGLQHPVYIDDLVAGTMCVLRSKDISGEVFHMGGPDILTIREMVEEICAVLTVPVPRVNLPYQPMRILGRFCELICGRAGLDPVLSVAKVDFFVKNRAYSIDKARKLVGYDPRILFREGIRKALNWYREHKWL